MYEFFAGDNQFGTKGGRAPGGERRGDVGAHAFSFGSFLCCSDKEKNRETTGSIPL
jgi:hypothetical protein